MTSPKMNKALEDRIKTLEQEIGLLKKDKDELLAEQSKYSNIIENIEDGYFEIDLAGDLTYVNEAVCKISGYTRDELLGMNNRDYSSPETAKKMYHFFNRVYRTGQPASVAECEAVKKDGSVVFLELSVSLMRDELNEPIGFHGVVRDSSERIRGEKERNILQKKLEEANKMEAIGTLAGGIAHDFNNILMGIQGNVSLMILNTDTEHPHRAKLNNIERYIQNGSELTRQLLNFALSGKTKPRKTDMTELVSRTSRMFGRTKKEIRVHNKDMKKVWWIAVDQGQMKQVLLNLYLNAWHAMPGGGDLFLQSENVELDEKYVAPYRTKPGKYVKISVTDTGVGMDDATLKKSFDPFFTTRGKGRGAGLGLATVYGIVKSHGGIINAYSEKEHGTTINIYLPATFEEDSESNGADGKFTTGTGLILLVDDEDMILEVGEEILQELGYTVLTARDGESALKLYKKNIETIDLVILDLIMPDMSGSDAFDKLKDVNPDIKILLASGYSINGQATQLIEKGCDGFIQKPFNMKALSEKIGEVLSGEHPS